MLEESTERWKTNNQSYGELLSAPNRQPLKHKLAISTLDILKKADPSGYVHEQQNIAQRERHGLFTQPPWLSHGDKYLDKKPDECSKNIKVNPHLVDKVQPQLFSRFGPTNIPDLYCEPFRTKQLYLKQKVDLIPHKQPFLGTHNKKTIKSSEFKHMKYCPEKMYTTREENGNVRIGKRNFYTSPTKQGKSSIGHLIGKFEYVESPYDLQKQFRSKEKAKDLAKINQPFLSASHSKQVFTPDYVVMKNSHKVEEESKTICSKSSPKYGPWKGTSPSKIGYNNTISKLPQYIEEGERKRPTIVHEAPWVYNFNGTSKGYGQTLSRPSPVPSQMVLNDLRRSKN